MEANLACHVPTSTDARLRCTIYDSELRGGHCVKLYHSRAVISLKEVSGDLEALCWTCSCACLLLVQLVSGDMQSSSR